MNPGSIIEWVQHQAVRDVNRNLQPLDLKMHLAEHGRKRPLLGVQGEFSLVDAPEPSAPEKREVDDWKDPRWENRTWEQMTIALIAHDDMKQRMVEFALDFATELAMFGRILATGTTGKEIGDAVPGLTERVRRCHSGPKGGDIEIATEILLGYCQVVIFFVDSQHPHPHPDDIRTVFGACMARPLVRMITNEIQAREWMETVVRPGLTTPS
jgi:methylglyoxal synthase